MGRDRGEAEVEQLMWEPHEYGYPDIYPKYTLRDQRPGQMPVSPNGVPPDPQPFEPQLIFYLLGHFRIATELFRVAGIRESRNSDFGMLRGGDSGGGGDSEETDASRTRRKRNRTPREKLEKYKKMVKKLE
eukprot:1376135-Amorphochlora_amoeboformis.AAC.2